MITRGYTYTMHRIHRDNEYSALFLDSIIQEVPFVVNKMKWTAAINVLEEDDDYMFSVAEHYHSVAAEYYYYNEYYSLVEMQEMQLDELNDAEIYDYSEALYDSHLLHLPI